MPIVQLEDGTKINFAKTPTPQEVDFAYQKIKSDRQRSAMSAEATSPKPQEDKGFVQRGLEKVADVTGGKKIIGAITQSIANRSIGDTIEKTQQAQAQSNTELIERIKKAKAEGRDTTVLQTALDRLQGDIAQTGEDAGGMLNPEGITSKQIAGDALQLGANIASAGTYGAGSVPSVVSNLASKGGFFRNLARGSAVGAIEGGVFGVAQGASSALKEDGSVEDVVDSSITGGILGSAFGGILGGVFSGGKSLWQGKKTNDAIIEAQEKAGIRPTLNDAVSQKTKTNPDFKNIVNEAKKQGYDDKEINFLATVNDADKPVLKEMFELATGAQSNPRQIRRPADVLGDTATNIVRQVETQNKKFGKAVDTTARGLKGQIVDASPVNEKAVSILQDAGVTVGEDGLPDWSKSVFSKTPELQKKLQNALSDLPSGEMDAYDLHNFKKSIDEIVEYGVSGEGLKGRSARILKEIRKTADDVLDTNFEEYNFANTEFKATRDVLDAVRDVVGTKVDFSTDASAQAFGQRFRSAFSNNTSRGKTLQLIETLQTVAKDRKLTGAEQNLLDQAIYVNLLEDQFGSSASTGLASEVRKGVEAVKTGEKVIEGIANPLRGIAELGARIYDKSRNISPEAKKELLKKFID